MKSLLKVTLQDGAEVFLLSEIQSENNIKLNILDLLRNESFYGFANERTLRAQAATIGITFSNFFAKATAALFQRPSNDKKYLYTLEKKNDSYTFEWKIIDCEETIIKLGYVNLEKENFTRVCTDILTCLSDELFSCNQVNLDLKCSLETSEKKNIEIMEVLSVATEAKQSLEKELFSKFIRVLNTKKRKIRDLCNQDSNISSNGKKLLNKNKKTKYVEPMFSDSSNDADNIDKTGPSSSNGKKLLNKNNKTKYLEPMFSDSSNDADNFDKPGPSSSTKNSMFMDDEIELTIPITPCKMRNRKAAVEKVTKNIDFKPKNVKPVSETIECDSDDDLFKIF